MNTWSRNGDPIWPDPVSGDMLCNLLGSHFFPVQDGKTKKVSPGLLELQGPVTQGT